jgi:hypothetical protein
MERSKEMQDFLNDMFSRSRSGNQCVLCGSTKIQHDDFKDEMSRKEYRISFACQKCQDQIFSTSRSPNG